MYKEDRLTRSCLPEGFVGSAGCWGMDSVALVRLY